MKTRFSSDHTPQAAEKCNLAECPHPRHFKSYKSRVEVIHQHFFLWQQWLGSPCQLACFLVPYDEGLTTTLGWVSMLSLRPSPVENLCATKTFLYTNSTWGFEYFYSLGNNKSYISNFLPTYPFGIEYQWRFILHLQWLPRIWDWKSTTIASNRKYVSNMRISTLSYVTLP